MWNGVNEQCGYKALVFISSTPSFLSTSHLHHPLLLHNFSSFRERKKREMGNCQAIDAATLVIQHPSGKVEKLYWAVSASEIMKTNPGHYVALLISTTLCPTKPNENDKNSTIINNNNDRGTGTGTGTGTVRLTRIKLLRPTDTLVLGQVYRLITTQGSFFLSSFSV